MEKYFSRKFFLTIVVLGLVSALPLFYKEHAVSDTISLTVLVILASIGAAYGFINIKDAKLDLQKQSQELMGGASVVTATATVTTDKAQ